jgi:hypothetical protein
LKVDRLRAEAAQLEAEISALHMECGDAVRSHAIISGLRHSLTCEHEKLVQQRAAKLKLEKQVTQLRCELEEYHETQKKALSALAASNQELAMK